MNELITAIGLIFFIEGLLIAIFPSRIKSMLELIKNTPENKLNRREVVMAIKGGVCDLEWDIAEIRDWWSDDETLPEF